MANNSIGAARLKEARIAKGYSQQDLAERIGSTSQSIGHYENGARSMSADVIALIAKELEVPASFFIAEKKCIVTSRGPLFFRAKKTIRSNKHRIKYEVITAWIVELYKWIQQSVESPAMNLPEFPAKDFYSDADVEDMASALRAHWGLGDGPIRNLNALVEANGIMTVRIDTTDIGTDAFSGFFDGKPYVFLNRLKNSASRTRFDIAHELGHIVMHNHLSESALINGLDAIETQADYFAGAFLMPASSFAREVADTSLAGLGILKERWGASIQSMVMRSYQLGLIDDHRKTELFRQISFKGWRKGEPNEDVIKPDDSSVGKKSFQLLLKHDPYMATRIQNDQLVLPKVICTAFNLDTSEFNPNNVIQFQPSLKVLS